MEVKGPGGVTGPRGPSKAGSKKNVGDSSFSGMLDEAGAAASAQGASSASPVMQIDALLSLQDAGDGTSGGKKNARERAEILLGELDKVRLGLLAGGIPVDTLNRLSRLVSQQRETVMDPHLAEVLDDIDLRVQVELAKYYRR